MKANSYRTHHCEEITESLLGHEVTVSGWVEAIRDHGGVLFLDLRDTTEVLQVVSNDDKVFRGITKESVIRVKGVIRKRDEETYNPKLKTGTVELLVSSLDILSKVKEILPFEIRQSKNASEDELFGDTALFMAMGSSHSKYIATEIAKIKRNQ